MTREKVIEGLEYLITAYAFHGEDDECLGEAVELLKEQEPAEAKTMGESKSHGSWWFACGACGHAIDPEDNFCRECGRKIKWDD